ncbi:MAG: AMP-binding protein [Candidatus Latescibacterota bacterium]|nr:MAG: AMP-binding protein [Candidatus Latescibacterota bacterium]
MLVNEFLEQSARTDPDKVALVCQGQRLTYGDIDSAANSIADGLIACGVQANDRVALYLENSVEAVVSILWYSGPAETLSQLF